MRINSRTALTNELLELRLQAAAIFSGIAHCDRNALGLSHAEHRELLDPVRRVFAETDRAFRAAERFERGTTTVGA
jgi:hypothetical protein